MKYLIAVLAALLFLNTTQAFAAGMYCRDNYTKEFPGTLYVVSENNALKSVYYADKVAKNTQPRYQQVQALVAASANKFIKGGGIYQIEIQTAQGLIAGKLSVNSFGDELTLETSAGEFVLSCQ